MFNNLQKKWKVSGWQVLVILIIFALGGSLTGFIGRKLMNVFEIEMALLYILIYVLIITIIWPAAVMVVSIPFGQFPFFRNYIVRIGNRLFNRKKNNGKRNRQ
jgi:hypothetical protein